MRCGLGADGPDQLMNVGGNVTLLLYKCKELKEQNAKSGFECAADEHTERQAAEAAEQSLTSSRATRTKHASSSRTTRASHLMPQAHTS